MLQILSGFGGFTSSTFDHLAKDDVYKLAKSLLTIFKNVANGSEEKSLVDVRSYLVCIDSRLIRL